MSAFSIVFDAVERLADASMGPILAAKWTLLLALAWLAHAALAGRNPRWRVGLWRGVIVGIGLIAALSLAAPIVRYPIGPPQPRALAEQHEEIAMQPHFEPAAPAIVISPPEPPRVDRRVPIAPEVLPDRGPAHAVPIPMPMAAPSPAADSWPSQALRLASSWALSIWMAGALILTARLVLASLALARLIRRSSDATDDIARECRAIAGRLGCTRTVRVVCSAEVATPCLAGLLSPVLLLPECENQGQSDLPAILAHELAHARNHDLAWNLAAHVASIVLWFHPLAWRIRTAHVAACDAVSDAVAADYLGDVASYGRTLARLAVYAARPAPAHVLAMARTSEVWRRLDALNQQVFRNPLSWRLIMPALGLGGLLLVLIGGFGVTRAAQDAATPGRKPAGSAKVAPAPAAPAPSGRIVVRAVEAASGEPIDGVSIRYRLELDGKSRDATVTTGEDGTATIEWEPDAKVEELSITARKPKLVPIHIIWSGEQRPLVLPEVKELRLEPGITIGGVVKDEAGRPIAGAAVEVLGTPTESDPANLRYYAMATVRTDAQGRWRLDAAPKDLSRVLITAKHPGYRQPSFNTVATLGRESVLVLKQGLTVTGRVVDANGRPVRGARAVVAHDRWGSNPPTATTDASGAFTIRNCNAGAAIITVQAAGFAPQILDVRIAEKTAPVEIRMTEPGATIRGKVVDIAGKPVAGAFVAADTWRGQRTLQFRVDSDKDGRFEWHDAPKDVVLFDIGQDGYMASRGVPLTASDREQTVVLHPKLVIAGRVTDATNGRPVPRFRVVQGRPIIGEKEINWHENEGVDGSDGRFTSRFDEPSEALYVRVEAPGYKPAESRAFRPDEGRQTFDFALRPEAGFAGIVQLPDGHPAEGAVVVLATRQNHVSLSGGRIGQDANVPRFTTGPDGRFAFAPTDARFLLIAVSDAGFADASSDEFAKSNKLMLQPWGRIEGGVRIGARSGADQEVAFNPTRPRRDRGMFVFSYGYTARTDDRGRFAFDRVIPGPGSVSRVVVTDFLDGGRMHAPCWPEPVEVKPGQTAQVKIGGKGRPVIGRLATDGAPEFPVDWTHNEPVAMEADFSQAEQSAGRWYRVAANIDKDGRFRIDDVPAGRYNLRVTVYGVTDNMLSAGRTEVGRAEKIVEVPDIPGGRSNEPLDLGTIKARLHETLKPGDPAPDFTVRRIGGQGDGDRIKLRDHQGKLVLIDFRTSWDDYQTRAELLALTDIQKTFGGDPRFGLITLWCDRTAEQAGRTFKEKKLTWAQGFAGSIFSPVGVRYKLRTNRATFLVGPDGRILAKNLRGAAINDAIARSLKDESLFKAKAWPPRPGRFPVTRFGASIEAPGPGPTNRPMVVVLDDCDPDFREVRPHHDALRILRAARGGAEDQVVASSFPEYHTCQTIGGIHGVAIDRERGRIYFCELVANRVVALDFQGRKLWHVDGIYGGALAVDPRTGNLWCTVGQTIQSGETIVLDATGREVATIPVRGLDIAYDPRTDGFWLVGVGITKVSREGKVLFHKPQEGWASTSVAVDPRDGSVWVIENANPDVARSVNRLWHLDSRGGVLKALTLGQKNVAGVAFDPKTGTAWAVSYTSEILRFTADGRALPSLPIKAMAIAVSPTTGQVWVTTETEVIGLDADGRPAVRSPIGPKSGQSWLAAY